MIIDISDVIHHNNRFFNNEFEDLSLLIVLDNFEELESLGNGFYFFSLFYFIICTIALVVSCFSIVVIILTLKKLKASAFFSYLFFSKDFIS